MSDNEEKQQREKDGKNKTEKKRRTSVDREDPSRVPIRRKPKQIVIPNVQRSAEAEAAIRRADRGYAEGEERPPDVLRGGPYSKVIGGFGGIGHVYTEIKTLDIAKPRTTEAERAATAEQIRSFLFDNLASSGALSELRGISSGAGISGGGYKPNYPAPTGLDRLLPPAVDECDEEVCLQTEDEFIATTQSLSSKEGHKTQKVTASPSKGDPKVEQSEISPEKILEIDPTGLCERADPVQHAQQRSSLKKKRKKREERGAIQKLTECVSPPSSQFSTLEKSFHSGTPKILPEDVFKNPPSPVHSGVACAMDMSECHANDTPAAGPAASSPVESQNEAEPSTSGASKFNYFDTAKAPDTGRKEQVKSFEKISGMKLSDIDLKDTEQRKWLENFLKEQGFKIVSADGKHTLKKIKTRKFTDKSFFSGAITWKPDHPYLDPPSPEKVMLGLVDKKEQKKQRKKDSKKYEDELNRSIVATKRSPPRIVKRVSKCIKEALRSPKSERAAKGAQSTLSGFSELNISGCSLETSISPDMSFSPPRIKIPHGASRKAPVLSPSHSREHLDAALSLCGHCGVSHPHSPCPFMAEIYASVGYTSERLQEVRYATDSVSLPYDHSTITNEPMRSFPKSFASSENLSQGRGGKGTAKVSPRRMLSPDENYPITCLYVDESMSPTPQYENVAFLQPPKESKSDPLKSYKQMYASSSNTQSAPCKGSRFVIDPTCSIQPPPSSQVSRAARRLDFGPNPVLLQADLRRCENPKCSKKKFLPPAMCHGLYEVVSPSHQHRIPPMFSHVAASQLIQEQYPYTAYQDHAHSLKSVYPQSLPVISPQLSHTRSQSLKVTSPQSTSTPQHRTVGSPQYTQYGGQYMSAVSTQPMPHESLNISAGSPQFMPHESLHISAGSPQSMSHESLHMSAGSPQSMSHESLHMSAGSPQSMSHGSLHMSAVSPQSMPHQSLNMSAGSPQSMPHQSLNMSAGSPQSIPYRSVAYAQAIPGVQGLCIPSCSQGGGLLEHKKSRSKKSTGKTVRWASEVKDSDTHQTHSGPLLTTDVSQSPSQPSRHSLGQRSVSFDTLPGTSKTTATQQPQYPSNTPEGVFEASAYSRTWISKKLVSPDEQSRPLLESNEVYQSEKAVMRKCIRVHESAMEDFERMHPYIDRTCPYCFVWFDEKSALHNHLARHERRFQREGRNLYVCGHCWRDCRNASELTRHLKTSLRSTNYQCYLCVCTQTSWDDLLAHMHEEHPGIARLCGQCLNILLNDDELNRHATFCQADNKYLDDPQILDQSFFCRSCYKRFWALCEYYSHFRDYNCRLPWCVRRQNIEQQCRNERNSCDYFEVLQEKLAERILPSTRKYYV